MDITAFLLASVPVLLLVIVVAIILSTHASVRVCRLKLNDLELRMNELMVKLDDIRAHQRAQR